VTSKSVATRAILVLSSVPLGPIPAAAIPLVSAPYVVAPDESAAVEQIRAGGGRFHGGRAAVGRHPGFHTGRPVHGHPGGGWSHRPGYRPPVHVGGVWRRPGAALGFVGAAAAASWAGAAPDANYCWYFTDPSRTRGFWDVCP